MPAASPRVSCRKRAGILRHSCRATTPLQRLDLLEPRYLLSAFYDYTIVAATGQTTTTNETLEQLTPTFRLMTQDEWPSPLTPPEASPFFLLQALVNPPLLDSLPQTAVSTLTLKSITPDL